MEDIILVLDTDGLRLALNELLATRVDYIGRVGTRELGARRFGLAEEGQEVGESIRLFFA